MKDCKIRQEFTEYLKGKKDNLHHRTINMTTNNIADYCTSIHPSLRSAYVTTITTACYINAAYMSDNCIVLDPAASDNLFKSSNLLTDIRRSEQQFQYNGLAGALQVTQCGDFGEFEEFNFSSKAPANIMSFSTMWKRNIKLEYDYETNTFYVYG